jgi:hypothetical protein
VQVQHIQQIEIEVDQIFKRIKMLWNSCTGKTGMGWDDDLEALCQPCAGAETRASPPPLLLSSRLRI